MEIMELYNNISVFMYGKEKYTVHRTSAIQIILIGFGLLKEFVYNII